MIAMNTLAPNQVVLNDKGIRTFYSYNTPICRVDGEIVTLYPSWDYSKTTSKYRSQFLNGETTKETKAKLDDGTYLLGGVYGD